MNLIRFKKKRHQLIKRNQLRKSLAQVVVVSVVVLDVASKKFQILSARFAIFALFLEILERGDVFFDSALDDGDVQRR